MLIRKLRLQEGWSQEQLAEMSGLSVRTVQRIEQGSNASIDSLKSIAAVLNVDFAKLQPEESTMSNEHISEQEQNIISQVKELKEFYGHLFSYVITMPVLFVVNNMTSPQYAWVWWVFMGWTVGLICHGLAAYGFFEAIGPDSKWEKREIEKRLGRDL